jgi:hypothetical protein
VSSHDDDSAASNDDLAAAIETNREEIQTNRAEIPKKVREFADLSAVYHQLRYFLLASVLAFLVLATLVAFNYRQSLRAAEVPAINTHILCTSLAQMAEATGTTAPLPGECTEEVLNDHDHPVDD